MKRNPDRFRNAARALLTVLAIAALALPAAAQSELPGIFGEVIDVRVVNLEVVVTDRRGNRVNGLSPEDFRLRVDGDEVPITYFTEVVGGQAVVADGERPVAGLPSLTPGEPVGTSYLVFIDDFFAIQRDRDRVLDELSAQLPLLGPADRMAVVAYDGRRLSMLSSWSNSVPALERALKEAHRRPAHGLARVQELRSVASTRGLGAFESAVASIGSRLTPEERAYAERLEDQVGRQMSAAAATLRSFASPPGRKVMLLLSGGWPFDPAQVAAGNPDVPVLDSDVDRGAQLYAPLADTANLLGYTLYPVDVPGLQGSFVEVGQDSAQPASLSAEQELQSGLSYLAARTGGRALLNSLRVDPLGQAAADTRSYYWLGFTPEFQRDDRAHRIKLDVLRPGLRVRARKGFLDFSRQAQVTAMVESSLLFGNAPPAGALPVAIGEAERAGRNKVEVPLSIAIPVDAITVLPVGDRFVSELELRLAVLDERGNQTDIPVTPLKLEQAEAPAAGTYLRYDTRLKLRRIKQDMVVSIYDPASGRLLTNQLELDP